MNAPKRPDAEPDFNAGALSCGVPRVSRAGRPGKGRAGETPIRRGVRASGRLITYCSRNGRRHECGRGADLRQGVFVDRSWNDRCVAGGGGRAHLSGIPASDPDVCEFRKTNNAIGSFSMGQDFTLGDEGVLEIDVRSPGDHDVLIVGGTARTCRGCCGSTRWGIGPERAIASSASMPGGSWEILGGAAGLPCPTRSSSGRWAARGSSCSVHARRHGTLRGFPGGRFGGFNDSSDSRGRHSETGTAPIARVLALS